MDKTTKLKIKRIVFPLAAAILVFFLVNDLLDAFLAISLYVVGMFTGFNGHKRAVEG